MRKLTFTALVKTLKSFEIHTITQLGQRWKLYRKQLLFLKRNYTMYEYLYLAGLKTAVFH